MAECAECGAHVTSDFVRVFGVDGEVRGCLECAGQHALRNKGGVQ